MALSHTLTKQVLKQSDDGKKRKMNRGGKAVAKSPAAAKSAAAAAKNSKLAGMRSSPSGRGHRRMEDKSRFDANERPGGEHIVDKRFFDGFIDDFDMSDLS
mmetsp:Transcript_1097/g.2291  ORF Transcript_1097/g.2291 Transcript_1097/m.2291 type:complete len:101 (-) Transcript_1097:220-522(-)